MKISATIPFYHLLAGMMSGGMLFRHASAFLLNSKYIFVRGDLHYSRLVTINTPLRFRGGGTGHEQNQNSLKRNLSATTAFLEKSKVKASSADHADIEKEAKASLSIVGTSVKKSEFYGLPYLDTRDSDEFRVMFVLGGPGAGKGTQSDRMQENYPCVHLSAGELLRAETKKADSPHKDLIENCLVSGNIVPVEISISLLEGAMNKAATEQGRSLVFLVDGFPRNFDNLDGWIRCMKGVASVWGVLNYQCPLEELERRILERAKNSGRTDDNLESARKRFATFQRETEPVVKTLRKVEDILNEQNEASLGVFDLQGDRTVDEVWDDTKEAMNTMISNDVLTGQSELFEAIETGNAKLYRKVCAEEWFEEMTPEEVLKLQEGSSLGPVSNVKLSFICGTKVAVAYDRVIANDVLVEEKRIWSHTGISGWKNIHFSRLPKR